MYYLSDYQAEFMFRRKPRKDKGRKRKGKSFIERANPARSEGQKILSSVNRTSEELRGWTNTGMRLKRMIDGNF
jgi:hypothetical protein